ncbi:hypothetical protein ES705_32654 [subsurface metagenome]
MEKIHEDEIVKIAWEAFEKRGYALYADYNEHKGTFGRRWMGAYPNGKSQINRTKLGIRENAI